ncbi:MAG: NADPH-dependent glutamate synthase [Oscillospiraceae bacterium]|nr:NADPH-dependent glutamate synthase [Oscillospiraceae bacterium]MBQ4544599.1 NADPH-dependent glutamate synthase [Oscillospiraceae bacterium]
MANMALKKNEMPQQKAEVRCKNFCEVALGYTEEQAIDEAKRCLGCKTRPCVHGCPVSVQIPEFLAKVSEGDFEGAYQIITETNSLPAVCGRVCPQETQCESKCVRGIKGEPVGIGRLERFVADYHMKHATKLPEKAESNGHRVAVIGAGPSGLACAGSLAARGYEVTIFEALHVAGGVLSYGIPEFRLPNEVVKSEIDRLTAMGVEIKTNMIIGKTLLIDELFEDGYEAVFIGSGAGLPKFMKIPGENLNNVYSANEFLTRINLMGAYKEDSKTPILRAKHTVVVGGGNVAMDAARSAKRTGADVTLVYRRTENELPARKEEVEHALEEGIKFEFLTSPISINGESAVTSITCQRMELSEPDESGRKRPVVIEGSEFDMECDCVIMAIGTSPNPLIASATDGLETHKWGGIVADDVGKTSRDMVWAGGDAVTGAATVILAMGAGKTAAEEIDKAIMGR